jgi:peroxiredoxin Q/BCP
MTIEPGQPFPSFSASSFDGKTVDLATYRGTGTLVVFFYPKATTRGCVRETTEFSARRAELDALGAKVVGISVDDVALQNEHAIQCAASFPLLCDVDKALTTKLGILNERGMASRTTYLIGEDGVVRKVFPNVSVDGHVDEVIEAVKQVRG